jgi:hypothetical protein
MGEVVDIGSRNPAWLVVREKCRACGFSAIGVVHRQSALDRLQCGKCYGMASTVTHFLAEQRQDGLLALHRIMQAESSPVWTPRLERVP